MLLAVSCTARQQPTAPTVHHSTDHVADYVAAPVAVQAPPAPTASTTAPAPATRPAPAIERALVISVDGLRPDLLLRANTPVMHKLFQSGCYSFWARTTAVSITLPSHVSMLTGATPNRHGIMWNSDLPLSKPVYPSVPTLFEYAHRAGYTTAIAAGKSKFSTLRKPGTVDWFFIPSVPNSKVDDTRVAEEAVHLIHQHKPQVMFVHFPGADNVGHAIGWGTPRQIQTIEGIDADIGEVLAALEEEKVLYFHSPDRRSRRRRPHARPR